MSNQSELRIGQGIDVHQLVEGRRCIIGGVEIPHPYGLDGHSDADVLLHAITDAILGACGSPDIGSIFPNDDIKWKDADSLKLLCSVWERFRESWSIVNVDSSILAEAPKMAPHIPEMKERIAGALGVESSRIGIKATTTETMGFIGRREGIVASAVVLLSRRS